MSSELSDPQTFDIRAASRVLGVSEPSLRRAVASGHLPTVSVPGIRRILLSRREIERILHGTVTPDAAQAEPAHLSAA